MGINTSTAPFSLTDGAITVAKLECSNCSLSYDKDTQGDTAGNSSFLMDDAPNFRLAGKLVAFAQIDLKWLGTAFQAKTGNPTGSVYLRIRDFSTDAVLVEKAVAVSGITCDGTMQWFELTTPVTITATDVYFSVEYTAGTAGNGMNATYDNTGASNQAYYFNTVWNLYSGKSMFWGTKGGKKWTFA